MKKRPYKKGGFNRKGKAKKQKRNGLKKKGREGGIKRDKNRG